MSQADQALCYKASTRTQLAARGGVLHLRTDFTMSLTVYKLLHILGILMVFLGLGGRAVLALQPDPKNSPGHKLVGILHGAGLLVVLVGGFGMLAKLGLDGEEMQGLGWVMAKIVIWILLGASIIVPVRKPSLMTPWLIVVTALAMISGYLAFYKPF